MPPAAPLSATDVLFSIKTFIAAMLAYWIAIRFDLPRPFWAVGTVYIIAHPLSGAITSKAVYRLLGTVAGGVMTVALVPALVNAPLILTLAMALWVGFCVFLALLDRRPRSYIFLLAGYTVLLAGMPLVDTPGQSFDIAVARVEEIGIAIICAAVVNRVIFPRHLGPVLVGRVEKWLADAAGLAELVLGGQAGDGPDAAKARLRVDLQRLSGDAVDIRAFTSHVAYDTTQHRELVRLMDALQHRMVLVLPLISALRDQIAVLDETPGEPSRAATVRALQGRIAAWMRTRLAAPHDAAEGILQEIAALKAGVGRGESWADLVTLNAAARMAELVTVWRECCALRDDIARERPSRATRRLLPETGAIEMHRDYGMAVLAALAAGLSILIGTAFWIASGWHNALFIPQIGGVFCCILATMDDPVPAMRKFLPILFAAMAAAFVYTFAIMPLITGFLPLAAALGLFLIPAGICLAIPRLFLVGMGLCINFPFMLGLQARLNTDLVTFLDPNIATVLGVILAIVVCSLVRSVGAETSARRLLRAGWREIAASARRPAFGRRRIPSRLIDISGLIAARRMAVPADSEILSGDPIRDLRAGANLIELRRQAAAAGLTSEFRRLTEAVAAFYEGRRSVHEPLPAPALALLDGCLADCLADRRAGGRLGAGALPEDRRRALRRILVALRLSLAPGAAAPLPAAPAPNVQPMEQAA